MLVDRVPRWGFVMVRLLLFTAFIGLTASRISAAPPVLDPQLNTPYRRQILVQFVPHPLFAQPYRSQFLLELQATLAPTLGELGTAVVLDLADVPVGARSGLTQAFIDGGFPALELPKFRELTGTTTDYLRVSTTQGTIRLESRRHDGDTGLCTPFLRTKETRDPQTASRLAGLMLARDFGPTATVEMPDRETDTVKVRFRGGRLPGFDRFIHVDDVLVVSEIFEQKKADSPARATQAVTVLAARPREYTILRIEAVNADGSARCRLLTGYNSAFSTAKNLVGIRAMKVPTTQAVLTVKIVDTNGKPPNAGAPLQIQAGEIDFPTRADGRDRLELRDGLYRTQRTLRNTACITVTLGSADGRRFPIPVYDNAARGVVTLRFPFDAKLIAKAETEAKLDQWLGRVLGIQETQQSLSKELTRLIIAGKNPQALERGVGGMTALESLDAALTAELAELRKLPEVADADFAARIATGESRMKLLRDARPTLQQRVEDLRKSIGKIDDPAQFEKAFAAKELNNRIRTLLEAGEVPEALDTFDQLYDLVKLESVKEQKAKIDAEWATKNDEHAKARKFLLGRWRELTELADFNANLDKLQDAAKLMTEINDRLGLRNLVTALDQTAAKLKDILDRLDPASEGDRASLEQLRTLSQALGKLEADARATIKTLENPR